MQEEQSPGRRRRWLWPFVALAVLYGGYLGVMAIVRAQVDHRIAENVGDRVPQFRLPTADGGTLSSEDLAGRRVVLNFFRSHCVNCDAEAPAIRALAERLPEDTVLVGVMTDRVMGFDPADTAATLERKAFRHPVVMADEAFLDAFHGKGWARVTPVTYFADRNGRIVRALRGQQTLESLQAALAEVP